MLVLGRTPCDDVTATREERRNEIVLTIDDVVIRVYLLKNNRGIGNRIGISAPKDRVNIVRGEIYESPTTQEGRDAQAAP